MNVEPTFINFMCLLLHILNQFNENTGFTTAPTIQETKINRN